MYWSMLAAKSTGAWILMGLSLFKMPVLGLAAVLAIALLDELV